MDAPRVLIVDDHVGFRTVARAMLQSEGFEVVGEAAAGGDALSAVARLRPGIVLLDIHLPDMDGFEVSQRAWLADGTLPWLSAR